MGGGCALHTLGVDHRGRIVRVVVVGAIDDEIIVFREIPIGTNGEESAAGITFESGTKHHQVLEVPPIQRRVSDCSVREGTPECVIGGFNQGCLTGDFDHFIGSAGVKLEVKMDITSHFQAKRGPLDAFEVTSLGAHSVQPGRELRRNIFAQFIAVHASGSAAFQVGDYDGCAGNDGSCLIPYGAQDAPGIRLC